MKKYALTTISKNVGFKTLYRIKALKDMPEIDIKRGDLGGYIEKESNLSQTGTAWISENARIFGYARISGEAQISGNAWISGNARISGDARISESAWILGNSRIDSNLDWVCTPAPKFNLTITNAGLSIGCEFHSIDYWIANYEKIGKSHPFTEKEIKHYFKLIQTINKMFKAQQDLKYAKGVKND